jgi:hypothetical protein
MKRCSGQYNIAAVVLFIKTYAVLAVQSGFRRLYQTRDILAAILCYFGHRNGIRQDRVRAISHVRLVHLINLQGVKFHTAKSARVILATGSRASLQG